MSMPSDYEMPWSPKQGAGFAEDVEEFAKKNATLLLAATVVLALLLIWNFAAVKKSIVGEKFGALMPGSTMDMQSQMVNGWGENFTTKGVENFSIDKKLFSTNEHAASAPAGRQTSYFAKETGNNNPIDIGSSAYKVLSDVKFDCANRNATNADSWAWMTQMAQQEVNSEHMRSDRHVDKNLYLAGQGY